MGKASIRLDWRTESGAGPASSGMLRTRFLSCRPAQTLSSKTFHRTMCESVPEEHQQAHDAIRCSFGVVFVLLAVWLDVCAALKRSEKLGIRAFSCQRRKGYHRPVRSKLTHNDRW